jgi:hypothetical protein
MVEILLALTALSKPGPGFFCAARQLPADRK